ncbi:MAG: DMT family transporter [Candidatus Heimdallarchaeaceae archaeon]
MLHYLKVGTIVFGWALAPVIGEFIIDQTKQFSPFQLSFLRYSLAAITLMIIFLFQNREKRPSKQEMVKTLKDKWFFLLVTSIFVSLMPICLFFAVKKTTASSASFLLNINVAFIPLIAFFLVKEKIKKFQAIGVSVTIIGSFLVIFDKEIKSLDFSLSSFTSSTVVGNLLALASGLSWAIYTVLLKKFYTEEDPLFITFLNLLLSSIFLFPIAFFLFPFSISVTYLGIVLVMTLAIVSTALAYTFWLDILAYMSTTEVGVIQVLVPVISALLAVFFLGETITFVFAIGAFLIIVGLFLVEKETELVEE